MIRFVIRVLIYKMIKINSRRGRFKKPISDIEHRVVDVRRVARVMAGGRRFSFRATVVAGNKKGKVGIGMGKGKDTAVAIEKALNKAKKSFIMVPITKDGTIPHDIEVKLASSHIILKPGRKGRGIIAGSSVRTTIELSGIENITAKILSRTTNKLNNAKATIVALKSLKNNKIKHAVKQSTTKK